MDRTPNQSPAGLITLALTLATLGIAPALAQAQDDDNGAAVMEDLLQRRESPAVEPTREPGREQVPERVGAPAPRVDVDPAVLGVAPGEPMPRLRREGEFIVNRLGRVVRPEESSDWIFQPSPESDADDNLPPMVIQPSARLEMIETFMQEREDESTFEVSGRVHSYRGVNYLLLTQARPQANEPDPLDAPDAPDAAEDAGEATTDVDADDDDPVIADLMQSRQAAPTPAAAQPSAPDAGPANAPNRAAPAAVRGTAPNVASMAVRDEGALIVQRRGRLTRSRDGAHVLFTFAADDRDSPEPPMIVQSCQLLRAMEDVVQQRGDQVVFVVSGQVQSYHGANYLLPTMMRIAPDRGNLQN
ncbi:MAG: hypothetical protein WD534_15590 [Phycisphaeraceae bacterium]